jgi:hypothetical protein
MKDDLAPVTWRKSTFSNDTGACVEVAHLGGGRAVRDSKNPFGAVLTFTAAEWSVFTAGVRAGQFD